MALDDAMQPRAAAIRCVRMGGSPRDYLVKRRQAASRQGRKLCKTPDLGNENVLEMFQLSAQGAVLAGDSVSDR